MPSPSVSVVIPTYNRVAGIRESLTSIYKQTFKNLEVILVDDGSEDETRELRQEFPIRYFYLDRPGWTNPSRPTNVAIRRARGDTIIFQCGGIAYESSDALAKFHHAIEDDPLSWVFGKLYEVNPHTKKVHLHVGTDRPRYPYAFCAIRKKHCLKIRGIDEDYTSYGFEDDDFATRIIDGLEITPIIRDDIVGRHIFHERPHRDYVPNDMRDLWTQKKDALKAGEITHIRNLDREWGAIDYPEGTHPKDNA